jgi:hypothetical protein
MRIGIVGVSHIGGTPRRTLTLGRVTFGRCVFGLSRGAFGSGRLFACGLGRTSCSHSVTRGRSALVARSPSPGCRGLICLWSKWVSGLMVIDGCRGL